MTRLRKAAGMAGRTLGSNAAPLPGTTSRPIFLNASTSLEYKPCRKDLLDSASQRT